MHDLTAIDSHGTEHAVTIDKKPDECPVCHFAIDPLSKGPCLTSGTEVQKVYVCPRHGCWSVFIAYYRKHGPHRKPFELQGMAPYNPRKLSFSVSISTISPHFGEIFQQASDAEALRLDKVCGVGYRKALEFIIKDYVVLKHPSDAEKIRAMFLGRCIQEYVGEQRLKDCAERATWLGNDETHYEKVWVDKDIGDLKALIQLTVNWIESEELTIQYTKEMPDKKQ
jgi:hypothetical protein